MKKNRIIFYLLIGLYSIVFVFTFIMQWISARTPELRLAINSGTLLLGLITGVIFYFLYQNSNKKKYINKEDKENKEDSEKDIIVMEESVLEEQEEIPLKDVYIKFANEYILTKRESQIGYLVLNGYTNQQIAEELYISETTVKKHLTHIYEKTQTSGRKEFNGKIKDYSKGS